MRVAVTQRAKLDLTREQDRYESEREGLGARFATEMDQLIARIAQRP